MKKKYPEGLIQGLRDKAKLSYPPQEELLDAADELERLLQLLEQAVSLAKRLESATADVVTSDEVTSQWRIQAQAWEEEARRFAQNTEYWRGEANRMQDLVEDAFGEGYRRGGCYPDSWEFHEVFYDEWAASDSCARRRAEGKS